MKQYKLKQWFLGSLLTSAAMLLGGCSVTPEVENTPAPVIQAQPQVTPHNPGIAQGVKPTLQQANQLMKKGRKAQAADVYYRAAYNYPSPQRERIILQAAEITASLGNKRKTEEYLQKVQGRPLKPDAQVRYRYVKSLIALHEKKPNQALNILPRRTDGLSKNLRDKVELVRQRAINMGGRYTGSSPTPIAVVTAPSKPAAPAQRAPQKAPPTQLSHYNMKPNMIGQQQGHTQRQAQRPQTQYQPPAQQQPPAPPQFALPRSTNKIAVLLPSKGALGKVGDEIYQGIKSAQSQYGSSTLSKRYSVNKSNALQQYQQAVSDGADIVVGPLDKGSLATLMAQPQALQVPVLSLNYITGTHNVPATLYQFGLSPEDEARQIAEFSMNRQQNTAVIMAPDSSWGKRLAGAFAQAYQQRGGTILNAEFYSKSPTTYLKGVRALLSKADGASMIFLAASPTQARLLRPLLKDKAAALPVYATSHIYSGREDESNNIDLDGIIYTEIPWVLQNQSGENLGELKYPRLFALGMDAVMIAKSLPQLTKNQQLAGKTGQISMNQQHRIQRQLEFATFKEGKIRRLGN